MGLVLESVRAYAHCTLYRFMWQKRGVWICPKNAMNVRLQQRQAQVESHMNNLSQMVKFDVASKVN